MDKSNLIVNYLPTGFVEDDLRSLFSKFGPIQSIKVCSMSHYHYSACF
jgi:RNA recognition motif-containing protein